jgi:hypothetical protein
MISQSAFLLWPAFDIGIRRFAIASYRHFDERFFTTPAAETLIRGCLKTSFW